jgi:hypothetical protein
MVSEAYANFGNAAVIMVGAAFGILCGGLMRVSAMASPLSVSMLIAIASVLTLCNVEADFSYTMVTMIQTVGGILLFAALPRLVNRRPARRVPYVPRALN